ncbi:MAG: RNA-guided pseudouridylation complex pseudouridine synthase subunit Cbf5 [Candidatus Micrarchaeota archaeon]|nr:RNA-guided pseudouridylation complex pseudouridine synthase subunit Cbf5 [Candidatus Micrarchaeota archaeon]
MPTYKKMREGNEGGKMGATPQYTLQQLLKGCFIPIDKPRGPPSAQVGQWAREIIGAGKNGHIGTLDPGVSGVLLVAINKAVRLSGYLGGQDKEYVGIMHLHRNVEPKRILEAVKSFEGKISQKPPLRSAVAKRVRERTIKKIEVLEIKGRDVLMRVECEGGTYIRKLMFDIGKKLGCGANMLELRRIRSGVVGEERCATLYELQAAVKKWKEEGDESFLKRILIPPDEILCLEKIIVKDSTLPSLAYGSPIYRKGLAGEKASGLGRGSHAIVYAENGVFCGIAEIIGGPEMYAKLRVNWLDPREFNKKWKENAGTRTSTP